MNKINSIFNYFGAFWNRSKQLKIRFAVLWLLGLLLAALFLEFLANDKPILAKVEESWYAPSLGETFFELGINDRYSNIRRVKWSKHEQFKIMPLIPYSAKTMDVMNASYKGPFEKQNIRSLRYRHWLGTDKIGRDVLAGLVNGCRVVIKIILIVGIISGLLSLLIGGFSGFLGDRSIKWSLSKILLYGIVGLLVIYAIYISIKISIIDNGSLNIQNIVLVLCIPLLVFWLLGQLYKRIVYPYVDQRFSMRTFNIPIDSIFYFVIVLLTAMPVTMILLALLGYFQAPSLVLTMSLFGLVLWKGTARIVRGEVLRIKRQDYILASKQIGLSKQRIFWRHVFPNIKKQFFVTLAMVVSASLLIEATLSFLGIGMAVGEISWGVLLSNGKSNISAYWLSLFPGILLIITVYSINTIAERFKKEN